MPAIAVQLNPFHWAAPPDEEDGGQSASRQFGGPQRSSENLPYRVELWDLSKRSVEHVLAVTASPSIGYAAFYAATREHPDRYVTLRHNKDIISRWHGPSH